MMRLSVILFIALCSATSAVCSGTGNTKSKVDYVAILNELAKKGRDESLNAAPFYKKAAELYVKLPEQIDYQELLQWPADLPNNRQKLLRQWVRSNSSAMAQLRLGTQKPYYWNQYQADNVWKVHGPSYLPELRDVVRATLFRVKLSATEVGMTREAGEDILTCCRFGSHLAQTPNPIAQLVGAKTVERIAQTLFLCLAKTDFDRTVIDLLQSRIRGQLLKIHNQTFNLDAEKLKHLEAVQGLFQGTEDDSKLKPDEGIRLAGRFGDLTYEDLEAMRRGSTMRDIEMAFAYFKEFLAMSPWQVREKGLNFYDDIHKQTGGNPVVRMCMFSVPDIARVRAQYWANKDALLTTVAILRFRDDRSSLPKDLQELLSAGYLSELPMDPYSDGPLVYRQTEDDFLLYSLGEDFDDDGGTHGKRDWEEDDYVFWPVQAKSGGKDG